MEQTVRMERTEVMVAAHVVRPLTVVLVRATAMESAWRASNGIKRLLAPEAMEHSKVLYFVNC